VATREPTTRDLFRGSLGRLTLGICLTMSIAAFEVLGSATAMPAALDDIGGISFYGLALSAQLVTALAAIPYGGRLVDRLGPARPLAAALVLFTVGLVGAGAAPSMAMVALFRGVQGLGGGLLFVLQLGIVAKAYPGPLRSRMLALLSAVWILPGLIGPGIAGIVADHLSWRWVFWGVVPLVPLTAALALPVVRHLGGAGEELGRAEFPWWGPIGLAGGVLAFSLSARSSHGWLLGVAGVAAVVAVVCLRPTLPPGSLRAEPGVPAAVATALFAAMGYLVTEQFVPLALTELKGLSTTAAGLPLTAAALSWTLGSAVLARTPSARRLRLAVVGGLVMAVGLVLTAVVVLTEIPWGFTYLSLGIAALGMGLVFTADQIMAVEWAEPGQEATTGAAIELANALGIAAGAGVAGAFVSRFDDDLETGLGLAFVLTISSALVATWTARRLVPVRRERSGREDGPGDEIGTEGREHRQVQETGG
jgi:MFS family permease